MVIRLLTAAASSSQVLSHSSSSFVAGCVALTHARRAQGRAIPWVPQGTVLDYTASQRHQQLNDMQHQIDVRVGRSPQQQQQQQPFEFPSGPVVMGPDGKLRPLTGNSIPPHPHRPQQQQQEGLYGEMPMEDDMTPHEELAHERALRERMYTMQHDSHGTPMRGIVQPPPPPPPPEYVPRPYAQPQPKLGKLWYGLVGGIGVTGFLMVKYGK